MEKKWWKECVVYQIYPRSFKDSNGDGIGDILGIIEKLDYLKMLGVSVIWLNPIFESPNDDMGYDISDYKKVAKDFGTMEDLENLIEQVHQRDMKLLLDLVVNHTSDEHPWFIESKKSKDNPYRNYYIWKDGVNNGPPNDWKSSFSGSAWEYDSETKQYYLHLFSKKQPDLNWDNPELRKNIYGMMDFWLKKGIDGFRMDVINFIGKNFETNSHINEVCTHDYLKEMNEKILSQYDIMTVGETPGVDLDSATLFVKEDRKELNMLFQFEHMGIDTQEDRYVSKSFMTSSLMAIFEKWQTFPEDCWNSLYLNNHDQTRAVSRFGEDGKYRKASAKMLAAILHMQRGTPYIYQGEEIGMTNCSWVNRKEWRDISSINYFDMHKEDEDPEKLFKRINHNSRDNSRTPMQWNTQNNAGFSQGIPWIKVNENYKEINVEDCLKDKDSIFYFYQNLIRLRKENSIMVYGSFQMEKTDNNSIVAFSRYYEGKRWILVANYSDKENIYAVEEMLNVYVIKKIISNYENESDCFKPYEVRVLYVKKRDDV